MAEQVKKKSKAKPAAAVPVLTEAEKMAAVRAQMEAVRARLGLTQEGMADLLDCLPLSYKRYVTGARDVPSYIVRSVVMLDFIHTKGLLDEFVKQLNTSKPDGAGGV